MLFGEPASQLALGGAAAAPMYGGGEQAGGWLSSSGHSTPPLDTVRTNFLLVGEADATQV